MKLIHKFKSPNFNDRKSNKVNFIILHYTSIKLISESIVHLCNNKNKVSSHYLISKSGKIYNLVSEKKRAWHAGQSYWDGVLDINSNSIGIELDYSPFAVNKKFSKNLISSLIKLLENLINKYKIRPENILGHSDIAPYRKIDPGENFPWYILEERKISYQIKPFKKNTTIKNLLITWFSKKKINSKKKIILFMLGFIGYDVSLALNNKMHFNQLVLNYSNRFKYYKSYNYNKKEIFKVIELHFLNILLTKVKK